MDRIEVSFSRGKKALGVKREVQGRGCGYFPITVEIAQTFFLLPNKDSYINGKTRSDVGRSFRRSFFFSTPFPSSAQRISGFH